MRTHGDWIVWISFFLQGVFGISRDAARQAGELIALRERYRGELKGKPRAQILVDELFMNPYTSVTRAQQALGSSNPTARAVVQHMEGKGLLNEITGRSWGKLFVAKRILDIIEPNRDFTSEQPRQR